MRNSKAKVFVFRSSVLGGAILSAQLLWSAADTGTANAQSTTAAPAAQQFSMEEIVVTAQKREERLQDVGLSVSAFGADSLSTRRIENVANLAGAVPGLQSSPSPNAVPVYTLRGVGFFESFLAAYPDVTSYIDLRL